MALGRTAVWNKAAIACACALAGSAWGCGNATRPAICLPDATTAIARVLAVPAGRIAATAAVANNAMPQCTFRAVAGSSEARVTANVDTAPQTYLRLERTVEEAVQHFSSAPHSADPQNITGLGLDADWFPDQRQLMTADKTQLLTVTVNWPAGPPARRQALAERVARAYLRHPPRSHA